MASGAKHADHNTISLQDGGVLEVLEVSDGEEEKKAAKRSGGRPSRARGAPRLWRNLRERALWRIDLAAAATVPRAAYCSLVLAVSNKQCRFKLEV